MTTRESRRSDVGQSSEQRIYALLTSQLPPPAYAERARLSSICPLMTPCRHINRAGGDFSASNDVSPSF
jgi:hypothetical protein